MERIHHRGHREYSERALHQKFSMVFGRSGVWAYFDPHWDCFVRRCIGSL